MKIRSKGRVRIVSAIASLASVCAGQAVVPATGTSSWKFTAGLGIISQPKFPGSGEATKSALPLLSADYGRYFIGAAPGAGVPAGLGAHLVQDGPWRLGIGRGGVF